MLAAVKPAYGLVPPKLEGAVRQRNGKTATRDAGDSSCGWLRDGVSEGEIVHDYLSYTKRASRQNQSVERTDAAPPFVSKAHSTWDARRLLQVLALGSARNAITRLSPHGIVRIRRRTQAINKERTD